MAGLFILVDRIPKEVHDFLEWSAWFQAADKTVERTVISDIAITTLFMGMTTSYRDGAPLLFETMVFGGEYDGYQEKYSTWSSAVKGHEFACELVKLSL